MDPRIGGAIESALQQARLDAGEIASRVALFDGVIAGFERDVGRRPSWAWWVPGRIEIFGKHTDYAGGRSLVAAVPRGFALAASPRDDGVVVARDARWQTSTTVTVSDPGTPFGGWANYVAVVVRRLAKDFPGASLGADLVFASDLPRASGVSSSSALVVAVASALIRRANLTARPEWAESMRREFDLPGYLGAVENGLSFGSFSGTAGVGTHGGSEDHTAILTCRSGIVSAYRYVPVRAAGEAAAPDHWRFVVMASGVEASKAGAVRDRYNALSIATRRLVDLWTRETGLAADSLGAAIESAPDAAEMLGAATRRLRRMDVVSDLETRLTHFLAEDARVPLALGAFQQADRASIGDLAASSQADADVLLRNQIPETMAMAALARESGAMAATSFGAGFGGSVWALAPAAEASRFAEHWRERYLDRFPAHAQASTFVARPATGLVEIPIPM